MCGVQVGGVGFVHGDVVHAKVDWESIGLIYMTDLLWDEPMREYELLLVLCPTVCLRCGSFDTDHCLHQFHESFYSSS